MYCKHCKKEVESAGNICPYCANRFTSEQLDADRILKEDAQAAATVTKSKAAAFILNYLFCGIGGPLYLGCKKLAKQRVINWIKVILYCMTVVGIIFAFPKMCMLIFSPITDMKNLFSDKQVLINDEGKLITWK